MIITQDSGFFVLKPKTLSFDEFRDKAKVAGGTYANEVVERIYDTLIGNAKDLKKDYDNYFDDEFDSFSEFLKKRCNADDECINNINIKLATHEVLYHRRPEWGFGGFIEMLFSDEMFEAIDRLTEL